jgi:hypothetical protein
MKKLCIAIMLCLGISKAYASELNNLASCTGIIMGDATIMYTVNGDRDKLQTAFVLAYAGYLGYAMDKKPSQSDGLQADNFLQTNMELIITKYETDNYTYETAEEVIECYQLNGTKLLEFSKTIVENEKMIIQMATNASNDVIANF